MTVQDKSFDKFMRLHEGEETLWKQSLALVAADENMRMHSAIIELGQDLLYVLIHKDVHKDDDDLTIRLLGIRLFNSGAASLKLLFSGYAQNAAAQMRDMLETAFLLDYFLIDKALIAEWRTCDKRTRLNKFGPASVRKALDDRDSFSDRRRDAHYNMFCELATHPTTMGFQMLRPDGVNAHCGPFLEEKAFKAALSELAKLVVQAVGIFTLFIDCKTTDVARAKIAFMAGQVGWMTRFFSTSSNADVVNGLRNDLQRLRAVEALRPEGV